jgi:DNA-binding NarL/FixJ family response regulator
MEKIDIQKTDVQKIDIRKKSRYGLHTPTDEVDLFIGSLYRHTSTIPLQDYRHWALQQLSGVLAFDAAVWSTGHVSTRKIHTHSLIGVPESFLQSLLDNLPLNPITAKIWKHIGLPVDMREVIDDEAFYQSAIYLRCFQPHGIERILSSLHIDSRSGIFTLLSVYRSDRQQPFLDTEKQMQKRLLFHLLNAASHAAIQQLTEHSREPKESRPPRLTCRAICDKHGIYHEVEPAFLDLIEQRFPQGNSQMLPFSLEDLVKNGGPAEFNALHVSVAPLGDLLRIEIRPTNPLDRLTRREHEIVTHIVQGLSFKVVGKQLGLSPSTVSNHLYRIYHKLNITSRTELAELVQRTPPCN